MAPKKKHPPVEAELAQDWLERHESGDSVPKIAEADGYDVRTVRKRIGDARRDREQHEARSMVLRNALEEHYRDDLCGQAKKLTDEIAQMHPVKQLMEDRLGLALRQHLPKSPLWKRLKRWNELLEEGQGLQRNLETVISRAVQSDPGLKRAFATGSMDIAPLVGGISKQLYMSSHGSVPYDSNHAWETTPAEEGLVYPWYVHNRIGKVRKGAIPGLEAALPAFEAKMRNTPEYRELVQRLEEQRALKEQTQEELAIIIHRRVVPGRCKYCPI